MDPRRGRLPGEAVAGALKGVRAMVNRLPAREACGKLFDAEAAHRVAPLRRNLGKWTQDECSIPKRDMRNGELGTGPDAAGPENDVEIERPRAPAPMTAATIAVFECVKVK